MLSHVSFWLALFVGIVAVGVSLLAGYAESMVPAPIYDNKPFVILIVGLVIAVLIGLSPYISIPAPHVSW